MQPYIMCYQLRADPLVGVTSIVDRVISSSSSAVQIPCSSGNVNIPLYSVVTGVTDSLIKLLSIAVKCTSTVTPVMSKRSLFSFFNKLRALRQSVLETPSSPVLTTNYILLFFF